MKKGFKIFNFGLIFSLIISLSVGLFAVLFAPRGLGAEAENVESAEEYNFRNLENFVFPNYDTEQVLGQVAEKDIHKPSMIGKHEATFYPSYFNPLNNLTAEEKVAGKSTTEELKKTRQGIIYDENMELVKNNLESVNNGTLGKHVAADGQFYGKVEDSTPRIIKKTTIRHQISWYHSLGVFAPAGEILTVTVDQSVIDALKGQSLTITIGYPMKENTVHQFTANYLAQNENAQVRMPYLYFEFSIKSTVTKIGSPFGGMVTLAGVPSNLKQDFDITVSGGVDSPSYKFGVSTKQDWQNVLACGSPYIWVLSPYIYFIMPRVFVLGVDDPYEALLFWHKSAMISNYSMCTENSVRPDYMVFDGYIPNGALALAYQTAFKSIVPVSWSATVLRYESALYDGSLWGAIHEFNHQYQLHGQIPWGLGQGQNSYMENTNNVMNALSFISYTDIASRRSPATPLGDWNVIPDPYSNLKRLMSSSVGKTNFEAFSTDKAFAYSDLIHNFGTQKFMLFLRTMFGYEPTPYLDPQTEILGKSQYLRLDDGFALFASQFFERDFVDYFTNVWHLTLSEETVKKIKTLKHEEFFSFGTLFSKGIKGVETGRFYKVNVGIDNILDFNTYTICSAGDDFELTKVTKPKHGTLTQREKGVYIYTPNADFATDYFEATFKVRVNGKTYTRVMPIELRANINFIEKVTYDVPNGLNIENAVALATEENVIEKSTATNFTSAVATGVNLTLFRSKVAFDKTGTVTFMVYGDDKTMIKIGDQTGKVNSYLEDFNSAKGRVDNKITLSVNAGDTVVLEAYCYNTGGQGRNYVKYSFDQETWADIPFSNCFFYKAPDEKIEEFENRELPIYDATVNLTDNFTSNFYDDSISVSRPVVAIKCVDKDGKIVPPSGSDHKVEDMIDEDSSTWFYSNYQNPPAFPHYYVMEMKDGTRFNTFTVDHHNSSSNFIKDFALYTSDDKITFTKVYEGQNQSQTLKVVFENSLSSKYFVLEVKNTVGGQNATIIRDVYFSESLTLKDDYNIYASNSSVFKMDDSWTKVTGNFVNASARKTESGNMRFVFFGTAFSVYAINAGENTKIYIDGKEYAIGASTSTFAPNFIIDGLKDGEHYVVIEASDFTFDAVKTRGTLRNLYQIDTQTASVSYTKNNLKHPRPVVNYGKRLLVEGEDYEVVALEYDKSTKKYNYTIRGINKFEGEIEGQFKVVPAFEAVDIADTVIAGLSCLGIVAMLISKIRKTKKRA